MIQFKHIYANGCSFTADNYQLSNNQPVYVDVLAQKFNATSENHAIPGSCNRRIIRSTLRDSYALPDDTLVIVQLTDMRRTERASVPTADTIWKFSHQDYKESVKPNSNFSLTGAYNDSLYPENVKYSEMFLTYYNELAELTDLIADVLMLTAHLRSRRLNYFVFPYMPLLENNKSKAQVPQLNNNILNGELNKDPRVLNLTNDSLVQHLGLGDYYYDVAGALGEIGHMNTAGVYRAADAIAKLIVG